MTRKILSLLLFTVGAFFLFMGIRDYLESQVGQSQIADTWRSQPQPGTESQPQPDTKSPPQPETETPRPPAVSLGDALAKLSIPRLNAEYYVVEGAGKKELRRGPGHLRGTAMPGTLGNCIIAGHRDTHFRVLKDLRRGDQIVVQTRDGEFVYKVTGLTIVSPKNTKSLQPSRQAVLHLITCYPFYYVGPAPKRFIVQAELANVESAAQPLEATHHPS